MWRLISCFQWRGTQRATNAPNEAPRSPPRMPKTATSPATEQNIASCPGKKMKITSGDSMDHIQITPTSPMKLTSDVYVGCSITTITSSNSLRLVLGTVPTHENGSGLGFEPDPNRCHWFYDIKNPDRSFWASSCLKTRPMWAQLFHSSQVCEFWSYHNMIYMWIMQL